MQQAMDRIARYFAAEYEDYDEDLPALQALAAEAGGPILELGCGAGRALVPLAEAGTAVTGVDISPNMLTLARERATSAQVADHVTLLEGDFSTFVPERRFAFAYCVMNTFLHLPDTRSQVAALKHWRDCLAPRGRLLIEVLHPDVVQLGQLDGKLEWQRTWTDATTGGQVMKFVTRTVDLSEQTLHVNAIYDETDPVGQLHRTVAEFTLRYLWRYEGELLLDKAGLTLEGLYGDWDMGEFTGASQQMIFLARRR